MSDPIRVMVVDDSAVVRGLISQWVDGAPDIEITGYAGNGEQAMKQLRAADPDIVLLDIEMPVLDGLSILPRIRKHAPDAKIIMVSSLTVRHARETFRALTMGATDYLPKPSASGQAMSASSFHRELFEKIRALAPRRNQAPPLRHHKSSATACPSAPASPRPSGQVTSSLAPAAPEIIVIGCSTGGPQALFSLFEGGFALAETLPVLIAQHMPPTFTTIFAKHLHAVSGFPAAEGTDGEILKAGHIYVAPGDFHMTVGRAGGAAVLSLDDGPPVNFCRPAVDRLFDSTAAAFGPAALAIVLTGMGNDGREGARRIRHAGGRVVIQDEASSVVWGMPGAVAEAGLEHARYPIAQMAHGIKALIARHAGPGTPPRAASGGAP